MPIGRTAPPVWVDPMMQQAAPAPFTLGPASQAGMALSSVAPTGNPNPDAPPSMQMSAPPPAADAAPVWQEPAPQQWTGGAPYQGSGMSAPAPEPVPAAPPPWQPGQGISPVTGMAQPAPAEGARPAPFQGSSFDAYFATRDAAQNSVPPPVQYGPDGQPIMPMRPVPPQVAPGPTLPPAPMSATPGPGAQSMAAQMGGNVRRRIFRPVGPGGQVGAPINGMPQRRG